MPISAGLYALAEAAAGLALAQISGHGRADWLPFIAVRPWLLAVFLIFVARWSGFCRLGAAASALVVSTFAVTVWIALLGGDVAEGVRPLAAGLALAAIFEAVLIAARWAGGRRWRWLAAALLLGLLLFPGAVRNFDRLSLGPAEPLARQNRPDLLLLSGLPLAWGEGDVRAQLSSDAASVASFAALARNFTVRPIAVADAASLARGGLLLMVQPRIDAAGLVAVDDWVRRGGAALILVDPDLRWPSRLPPGDPRRAPGPEPLAPLLTHWGLGLGIDRDAPMTVRSVRLGGHRLRVRPGAPGEWSSSTAACVVSAGGLMADCGIGNGRAVLIADADLLADDLWAGMGLHGTDRRHRAADNGPLLVALLDDLSGSYDPKAADFAAWIDSQGQWASACALMSVPALLLILIGATLFRRDRTATVAPESQQTYPQPHHEHKGRTMTVFGRFRR